MCVTPLKLVTLSLINSMLDNTDDLETRFIQRSKYWNMGIQPNLEVLYVTLPCPLLITNK